MLITPLCVHLSFLLKVIVLSTNADYPIVCPFVSFYLRLLCCPPMLITPLFVRSSFLLKIIVLSTFADFPIVCLFVLFT
jgi:hypothetical protein